MTSTMNMERLIRKAFKLPLTVMALAVRFPLPVVRAPLPRGVPLQREFVGKILSDRWVSRPIWGAKSDLAEVGFQDATEKIGIYIVLRGILMDIVRQLSAKIDLALNVR